MSLNIIKYPDAVVSVSPSKISKWSSIHHPIRFGLQRRDFEGTNSITGSTFIFVAPIGETMSFHISAGETLTFESPNFKGSATVVSTTANVIFGTIIESNTTNETASGYINVNSRQNFFAKTRVYTVDSENVYKEIGVSINKVDATGRAEVDVSSFLKSLVGYEDNFSYDSLNELDPSLGGRYNITLSENWTGHEGQFSGISETSLRYFVNSAKQIQDLFGSNMGEYVPFALGSSAKFLSDFAKPTYFEGYPHSIDFIYSEDLHSFEVRRREQARDINNGVVGGATSATLDHYQIYGVNRLTIEGGYAANVKTVEVWLERETVEAPFRPLRPGIVASGYFEDRLGLEEINAENIDQPDPVAGPTHIFTEAFKKAFA